MTPAQASVAAFLDSLTLKPLASHTPGPAPSGQVEWEVTDRDGYPLGSVRAHSWHLAVGVAVIAWHREPGEISVVMREKTR